ncbi:hypothetical protein IQ287_28635 [Burkholderia sp. R-69927]|uniref:hypothetical protein n=1 Tax=Paraburkholderia domus TaxID=2793075 RepID=UPI00191459FD|nr:hypothetical protein [Paraburkholderia domus]MBK5089926.1 hypothetical protein [Burkholderia sp. R-69927]
MLFINAPAPAIQARIPSAKALGAAVRPQCPMWLLEEGRRVLVKDHTKTGHYEVELTDGSRFRLPVSEAFRTDPESDTHLEQHLSSRGLRKLGKSTDVRVQQAMANE